MAQSNERTMRHEEKFICSERQLIILESRLKNILSRDAHQQGHSYNIRSIYFDTVDDRLMEESIQGVYRRNKYRIRIYDGSGDLCRLEKKSTVGQLKTKTSCRFSRETVENILSGRPWADPQLMENPVAADFYRMGQSAGLMPKIIVEYDRSAFVSAIGNIRVTFDRNIRASRDLRDFYSRTLTGVPVQPWGEHVLEVKYTGILPGYIARCLDIRSLQRISFSKYVICREVLDENCRIGDYHGF